MSTPLRRPGPRTVTRRELVRGAVATGAIAGISPLLEAGPALGHLPSDADLLYHVLGVENVIADAYEHVLGTDVLSAAVRPMISLFLDHERQHAAVLSEDLRQLARMPPARLANVAEVDTALASLRVTKRLSELRTERDAVELLIGAEAAVIGAYYVAISKLNDDARLTKAAQVMAAEAQHATSLRLVLHPRPVDVEKVVPNPFVEGQHQETV